MRVLFVSNSYPRDLRTYVTGSFQRMKTFIDAIRKIADIDLLFYVAPDVDTSPGAVSLRERELCKEWDAKIRLHLCKRHTANGSLSKWDYYFAGTRTLFEQSGYAQTSQAEQVKAFESCVRLKPDIVFVHRLSAMCPLLLSRETLPPVLFDLDDIEHVYFLRTIEKHWPWRYKLLQYSRLPALIMGEVKAIRLATQTFVCSEKDRNNLAMKWKLRGVSTIPNSVTIKRRLPVASEPTLLFLGAYWYQPNVQAADFLIANIWPLVRRTVPSARLIIAGSRPEEISAYSKPSPGVEFSGFAADLESLYRRSRVVCCPILRGGGTRIKIIEAAAYGKPIVATSIGAEGLDFRDGHELLLRDDPIAFANACVNLLANDSFCNRLGSAAHEAALRHYGRDKVAALIRTHVINAYWGRPTTLSEHLKQPRSA
jgi:glycosyltransferase involved in cell wall biosynthesis